MNKSVVVIPGEDAAPEAMEPSVALLQRLGLAIRWEFPAVGEAAMREGGDPFPDSARAAIDAADATLFGATSGASARALFYLRWGKRTYANLRPLRWSQGFRSSLADPSGVDLALVRENLEDHYLFAEGEIVVTRWTSRSTHAGEFTQIAPTGKQVVVNGINIHRVADGKIVETWVQFDQLGMLQQLGVVPAPGQVQAAAR